MTLGWSDLHAYQHTAIDWLTDHRYAGLFLRPGLGKTAVTLAALETLRTLGDVRRALVVAPRRVVTDVWPVEADLWRGGLHDLTVQPVVGTRAQREAALGADAALTVISRDNLVWLLDVLGNDMPYDTLVIDELSSFKGRRSQRFRALRPHLRRFRRRIGLTGSPAASGLLGLWSQMLVLDRGKSLGPAFTRYRAEYFELGMTPRGLYRDQRYDSSYVLRPEADREIYDAISGTVISMRAEDHLDLPERTDVVHRLTMPPDLIKRYRRFKREAVMEVCPDGYVTAANAAVLVGKLCQFANGTIYDEDHNFYLIHALKRDMVRELVDELQGDPVIIAYTYRSDLARLHDALPDAEEYDDTTRERWDRGEIPVLLLHPASAGHGLNLQRGGCTIIWYGLPWSLELYEQLVDRLHRQGQRRPVTVHHLVVDGTEDDRILTTLRSRDDMQQALLTATRAAVRSA